MLLGRIDVHAAREAFGADMREFALLWLVFAVLDVFVVDRLTLRWFMSNLLFCVVLWGVGAYIEFRSPTGTDKRG